MSRFQFVSDADNISTKQLDCIASALVKNGFETEKVAIKTFGAKGENHVAVVKRLTIEDEKTVHMIIKLAPIDVNMRRQMNVDLAFANEVTMYSVVFPKFIELQKEYCIPESQRLIIPKCYEYHSEKPDELLILEDLAVSDFKILDKMKPFSDEYVKLVLKNFAILHSLSYVLKKRDPESFLNLKKKLVNPWAHMDTMKAITTYLIHLETEVLAVVDKDKHTAIKETLGQAIKHIESSLSWDSNNSVIIHGDSHSSNLMFKFNNGRPAECILVDYQVSNVTSPAIDLQYFIFCGTDYETRSRHYKEWIGYYHSELDKCLANFDLEAKFVYPKDQLEMDLMRFAKYSLVIAILVTSISMRTSGFDTKPAAADDGTNKVTSQDKETLKRFKNRVEGLINSSYDLGYLKKT